MTYHKNTLVLTLYLFFFLISKHLLSVKPEYFPSMGRALIHAVKTQLGDKFTDETKDAWVEVYGALSYDMIRAQKMQKVN
jgi:hemoglobin-like flavoprotein